MIDARKISELPETNIMKDSSCMPIVQDGETRKIYFADLKWLFKGDKGEPGEKGEKGDTGVSIDRITVEESDVDEGKNKITILKDNGQAVTFIIRNGSKGDTGAVATVVQNTGDSLDNVMSQKAVSDELSKLNSDLTQAISEIYRVEKSKNLFNKDDITIGAIQSDGAVSADAAWGGYRTSDFISIDNGYYTASYVDENGNIVDPNRIILLMFDENYSPISSTYKNVTGTGFLTVLNENAKYIRLSFFYYYVPNAQFEKGGEYTSYDNFWAEKKILIHDDEKTDVSVTNALNEDFLACFDISRNMLDFSNSETGALQSDGSISTYGSWSNYQTTDYLDIKSGETYCISVRDKESGELTVDRKIFALYDKNKNIISGSYTNDIENNFSTFTPTKDGYVRISLYLQTPYNYQYEKSASPTEYEEPLKRIIKKEILPNTSSDILTHKKWAVCGDSFTEWTTEVFSDGEFTGKYKTYPYLIAERTGIKVEKFFASGRTMAYPSDGTFANSLTNPNASFYYQNIPSDADYITIYLGINDLNHASGSGTTPDGEDATGIITLGTINDTDTSTYYGAYNTVLAWLRENRPFAHIGIIVTNGTELEDWTNAQIKLAEKWGYPYINLNGDERTPAMIRTSNPNMSNELKTLLKQKQASVYPSNTHPNAQAHEYESQFIEAWLRTL